MKECLLRFGDAGVPDEVRVIALVLVPRWRVVAPLAGAELGAVAFLVTDEGKPRGYKGCGISSCQRQ